MGTRETRGQGRQGRRAWGQGGIIYAQCPMTADAPLGPTPRPHCLPNAQCPMPYSLFFIFNRFLLRFQ
ncbi:hypothetical protein PI95_019675 [Hassallia byssoidea VB512170]|uniref:Uncharacterized protein n=1 Tax=Hassallia byssoidea VB512170 TaxID=1304833 RepID=A0A846HBG8_9CYAN|nr:hypothetical protein [Hassalia byssoidea]NEU74715.1 hypothetical protein [Hassalia byssoidea VB512170]